MAADPKELVKRLRAAKGMSQSRFADLLDVTQSRISEWEAGERSPQADDWIRMGNLAAYPEYVEYYAQAGMDRERMLGARGSTERLLNTIKDLDPSAVQRFEEECRDLDPFQKFQEAIEFTRRLVVQKRLAGRASEASVDLLIAVARIDPDYAAKLQRELRGMDEFEQLARISHALLEMPQGGAVARGHRLTAENKELLKDLQRITQQLQSSKKGRE
jgi:transcriptional regulator with XRE-family HTH domain